MPRKQSKKHYSEYNANFGAVLHVKNLQLIGLILHQRHRIRSQAFNGPQVSKDGRWLPSEIYLQ